MNEKSKRKITACNSNLQAKRLELPFLLQCVEKKNLKEKEKG